MRAGEGCVQERGVCTYRRGVFIYEMRVSGWYCTYHPVWVCGRRSLGAQSGRQGGGEREREGERDGALHFPSQRGARRSMNPRRLPHARFVFVTCCSEFSRLRRWGWMECCREA
jgi:hypothetical protein